MVGSVNQDECQLPCENVEHVTKESPQATLHRLDRQAQETQKLLREAQERCQHSADKIQLCGWLQELRKEKEETEQRLRKEVEELTAQITEATERHRTKVAKLAATLEEIGRLSKTVKAHLRAREKQVKRLRKQLWAKDRKVAQLTSELLTVREVAEGRERELQGQLTDLQRAQETSRANLEHEHKKVLEDLDAATAETATLREQLQSIQQELIAACTCPITHGIMGHPVNTPAGHTFERAAITAALRLHRTCPLTRTLLTPAHLRADRVCAAVVALLQKMWPDVVEADLPAQAVPDIIFEPQTAEPQLNLRAVLADQFRRFRAAAAAPTAAAAAPGGPAAFTLVYEGAGWVPR